MLERPRESEIQKQKSSNFFGIAFLYREINLKVKNIF